MPNWAYNNEVIYGPEKEIEELYEKLKEWTSKNQIENGFGTKWIGNIVICAGFKAGSRYHYGKEPDPNELDCRGRIINDFDMMKDEDGYAKITFSSETAWGEFSYTWDTILAKHAPHCKYYFMSEEYGMCIFVKRDYKDRFFPFDYIVSVFIIDDDSEDVGDKDKFTLKSGNYSHEDLVYSLQQFLKTNEKDFTKLVDEVFKNIDNGVYGDSRKIHLLIEKFDVVD